MDSDSESKLIQLMTQLLFTETTDSEDVSLMIQIISLISSMDLDSQPKPESKLMSLVNQAISVFNSMDIDSQPEPLREFISLFKQRLSVDSVSQPKRDSEFLSLFHKVDNLEPEPELKSIISQISALFITKHEESTSTVDQSWRLDPDESKLMSLLSQLMAAFFSFGETRSRESLPNVISFMSVMSELISFVSCLDLDSQPKPQTKVMSLLTQIITVSNSMSDQDPDYEFISVVTQMISLIRSTDQEPESMNLLVKKLNSLPIILDSVSELGSLITQLYLLVDSSGLEPGELVSLSPQLKVQLVQGKFHVTGKVQRKSKEKGKCVPDNLWKVYLGRGAYATHFRCKDCNGEDHEECEKTPVEVKHYLHPKHSLQLVLFTQKTWRIQTRKCFCCDEDLQKFFYYCSVCDYGMNIACVEKQPVLSMDYPKWHKHTLALFPRQAFLTCNVCALADASSPIYMCPPCDFVVHLRCLSLPRLIKISRHPQHRISFTPSFDQGDWSCGVCRREIDNDYGGYSCIKDGCLYAAHSRCATQSNVWDGIELEGVPEDIEEEEAEPFERISDGVIQHFGHPHHHMKLDEDTDRDYNENKQCQACITPIYSGNLYSCISCPFILHEECAKISRKIYHPLHPHLLKLVAGYDGIMDHDKGQCSACNWLCTSGFFYECGKKGCRFKVHGKCTTISEPLFHGSHIHPLFLTSKPEEERACSICERTTKFSTKETFNCIKECEFSLCFECATFPEKARYKHDKHMLILSYGEETSTLTNWCEACERTLKPKQRFYKCDEYCCVTLHIGCLIGRELYMKPGASLSLYGKEFDVLPNDQHMSRPFCSYCKKRCPFKTVFQLPGSNYCTISCIKKFLRLGRDEIA